MRSASVRSRSTATARRRASARGHVERAPHGDRVRPRGGYDLFARRFLNRGQKSGRGRCRSTGHSAAERDAANDPCRDWPTARVRRRRRNHRVLHAVEQRFQFPLAGLNANETFFHAARRLIQRRRHLPISSVELDAILASSLRSHALGKIDDSLQTQATYCEAAAATSIAKTNALSDPRTAPHAADDP